MKFGKDMSLGEVWSQLYPMGSPDLGIVPPKLIHPEAKRLLYPFITKPFSMAFLWVKDIAFSHYLQDHCQVKRLLLAKGNSPQKNEGLSHGQPTPTASGGRIHSLLRGIRAGHPTASPYLPEEMVLNLKTE